MPRPVPVLVGALIGFGLILAAGPGGSGQDAEQMLRWRDSIEAAESARANGEPEVALSLLRGVVAEVDGVGQGRLFLARALDDLADLYRSLDRPDQAVSCYGRSVGLWRELLGPDQPRLAVTLHNLGVTLVELGRDAEAQAALAEALEIWETAYDPDSDEARDTRRVLSNLTAGRGESDPSPRNGLR